jgi:hypothetical protein
LNLEGTNKYQNIIGIFQCLVELGCIDVSFEITSLSRFLVQPRTSHLEQAYQIMAYLKSYVNVWLVMDDTYVTIPPEQFKEANWKSFYYEVREELLPDMSKPKGKHI